MTRDSEIWRFVFRRLLGTLPLLLEAKEIAFETMELQRIIPVMVTLLEYEWVTSTQIVEKEALECAIGMVLQMGNI